MVFTLPHELNALCRRNARILYNLLFSASAAAMLELATNPKWLGAQIGFISILHTWGQNLLLHPYVHCPGAPSVLYCNHYDLARALSRRRVEELARQGRQFRNFLEMEHWWHRETFQFLKGGVA